MSTTTRTATATAAHDEATGDGPLAGVRVLDLGTVYAAPITAMLLGDYGADVLKIEHPRGDPARTHGPSKDGQGLWWKVIARNKRAATLVLSRPEGREMMERLVVDADVLIENFRPGLMDDLGLSLAGLRAANERLVTCSLTAFGEGRPDAGARPGYDIIVQALSGLMSVTGSRDGEPVKAGVALLDVIAGLYAAIGILAALREREVTGRGRHVGVSLFDASVAAMVNQAANHLIGGLVPGPMGSQHPNIVPYQAFSASDRPFILAAGNDRLFARTCNVLGHAEWAGDPRFSTNDARVANREALIPMLAAEFAERTASSWIAALEAESVPCAPIRKMDEVFASPEGGALVQVVDDPVHGALRLVADPIRFDGQVLPLRLPPPALGADTDGVIGEP
jgi:crotonobetainyl-CoA:carnitine CoA-transferase CaiB-like acyl-CoA transferase